MLRLCLMLSIGLLAASGCSWLPTKQKTKYVTPKLSMSLSCNELVEHLNRQCHGLHAWRSMDTTVSVRMPNGLPHRLSGYLACEAPNRFRLTASSVVARADLGANAERCWFYSRPGDGKLLTWRHEDTELLQQVDLGIPRIDPDWLMEVLGVMPLNAEEFVISTGPVGGQELWLTAVSDSVHGDSLRRVIKVDTVSGMIREHVIYDQNRSPLVRAAVSNHKSINGHLLPRDVAIEFPRLETSLALRFGPVDTNCRLPENLWTLPENQNIEVVDLGNHLRAEFRRRGQPMPDPVARHSTNDEPPLVHLNGRIAPATDSPRDPNGFAELENEHQDPPAAELDSEFARTAPGRAGLDDSQPDWPAVKPFPDDPFETAELAAEPDWDLPDERRPVYR